MSPQLRRWAHRLALPALGLVGLALIVAAGFLGSTDPEPLVGQPTLEAIFPTDGADILAQDRVGADLQPGYDGELVVNGVTIPQDQLDQDSGLNQLVFRPGPGKVLTSLQAGRNCARIMWWRVEEGRTAAGPPRQWCFSVL
jgi:hypothetical protein